MKVPMINYHNYKVFFLSSSENFKVLKKMCIYGKRKWDWDISLVSNSEYIQPYNEFIDSKEKVILIPDFLKKEKWEDNPEQWNEIQKIMRECERIVEIPLNRILLSDERSLGRSYSKYDYYWPENKVARHVLHDNHIPEVVMTRIFKFFNDQLNEYKPTLCLGVAPGGLVSTVLYYLAQYHRIPCVASMFSSVVPRSHYWSSQWGTINHAASGAFLRKVSSKEEPSGSSLQYIDEFRRKPDTVPIYKEMWESTSKISHFLNINKRMMQMMLARLLERIRSVRVVNPKSLYRIYINDYRINIIKKLQRSFYSKFSNIELSKFKYIYYPCHQEPELVLNTRAVFWYNQLNTIKMLSYNLPFGYKLLVREHRNNVGRRSSRYLKEVKSYPGVILLDALDDQYKYIKNAGLMVTVNGASGFEGLLLKTPVLTLDQTFYDILGLAYPYKTDSDFGEAILNCINSRSTPDDYDKKIALLIDAEKESVLHDDADPELEMSFIQRHIDRYKNNRSEISFEREQDIIFN